MEHLGLDVLDSSSVKHCSSHLHNWKTSVRFAKKEKRWLGKYIFGNSMDKMMTLDSEEKCSRWYRIANLVMQSNIEQHLEQRERSLDSLDS